MTKSNEDILRVTTTIASTQRLSIRSKMCVYVFSRLFSLNNLEAFEIEVLTLGTRRYMGDGFPNSHSEGL